MVVHMPQRSQPQDSGPPIPVEAEVVAEWGRMCWKRPPEGKTHWPPFSFPFPPFSTGVSTVKRLFVSLLVMPLFYYIPIYSLVINLKIYIFHLGTKS